MGSSKIEKIIQGVRRFKEKSRRDFGIERVIVFGSAARGTMGKDSDVDLILVSKRFAGKRFVDRSVGLRKFWALEYPVDFLCYSPKEFNEQKKRVSLVSEAVREGIEV